MHEHIRITWQYVVRQIIFNTDKILWFCDYCIRYTFSGNSLCRISALGADGGVEHFFLES